MSTPGFTADHALAVGSAASTAVPDLAAGGAPPAERILPQSIYWGSFSKPVCISPGMQATSAIIWGIPWGQSWTNTCCSTPGLPNYNGKNLLNYATVPYACCNQTLNEWGYWVIPVSENTCPGPNSRYPEACWVSSRTWCGGA